MDKKNEMSFGERFEGYIAEYCRTAAMEKAVEFLNGNDFRDFLKGVVSDEVACQLRGRQEDTEGMAEDKTSGGLLTERQKRILLRSGFEISTEQDDFYFRKSVNGDELLIRFSVLGNLLCLYVNGSFEIGAYCLTGLVSQMVRYSAYSPKGYALSIREAGLRILDNFINCEEA